MKTALTTLSLLLSSSLLPAQNQASTLAAACDKADAIVLATVTAATDPSPMWHRLVWRTDELLSGQIGGQFTLMEPAGACCGRSLFALGVGQQRLLFLTRTGPKLHPFGGARGVISPEPAVLAHVRALLLAATPAQRGQLLAASLDHPIARIALDSAHALAAMPTLSLSAADRAKVTNALVRAVARGSTQSAALVDVTVRCADPTMLDSMLTVYLAEPRQDRARMLRRGLSRMPPALLTGRLPVHVNQGNGATELRAAQLLRDIPGHHGHAAMSAMLHQTARPRVQLCIAEGLLGAGTPAAALRPTIPAPVLELAMRRTADVKFRSIDPGPR